MKTRRVEVMIHFREQCNRLTECSHGLIGVVTTSSSSALYKAKSSARLCVCFCARTTCTHRAPTHLIFSHFLRLGVPDRSRAGQFRHNAQPPSQPLTVSISSIHWNALIALFVPLQASRLILSQLSPGSSCERAICPIGLLTAACRCSS